MVSVHLWAPEKVGRSSPGSLLCSGFLGSIADHQLFFSQTLLHKPVGFFSSAGFGVNAAKSGVKH